MEKRYELTKTRDPMVSRCFKKLEIELYDYLRSNQPSFYQELKSRGELDSYLQIKAREIGLKEHEQFQLFLTQHEDHLMSLDDSTYLMKIEQIRKEIHVRIQYFFMSEVEICDSTIKKKKRAKKRMLQSLLSQITLDPNWKNDPVKVKEAQQILSELLHNH